MEGLRVIRSHYGVQNVRIIASSSRALPSDVFEQPPKNFFYNPICSSTLIDGAHSTHPANVSPLFRTRLFFSPALQWVLKPLHDNTVISKKRSA